MKKLFMAVMLIFSASLQATTVDSVDVSQFVAFYDYTVQTQDAEGNNVTDIVKLAVMVGSHVTSCANLHTYKKYMDGGEDIDELYHTALMHFPYDIWTNWPKGKQTSWDNVYPQDFLAEEHIPELHWEILNDSMATTTFRGITWHARYEDSIPTTAGPWKLHGLPGLIVDAWSSDSIHHFALTSMKYVSCPIRVEMNPNDQIIKADKFEKYRNQIYRDSRYIKNPLYFVDPSKIKNVFVIKGHALADGIMLINKAHVYQPIEK